MNVIVLNSPFLEKLTIYEFLQSTNGMNVCFVESSVQAIRKLKNLSQYTIVIGSDNQDYKNYVKMLTDPFVESKPRTILISSLATSARFDAGSYDAHNVQPHPSTYLMYKVENYFWQIALLYSLSLHVLSVGLIYGGEGYDFKSILTALWRQKAITIPHKISVNKAPIIHCDSFFRKVLTSIASPSQKNHVVYCADGNNKSIEEVMHTLSSRINGDKSEIIDISTINTYEWLDIIWSCNFSPTIPMDEKQLENEIDNIWKDFLEHSSFNQITVIIIGGPKSGKTMLSKCLSERLDIGYLSIPEAFRHLLKFPADESCDIHSERRNEIRDIIAELTESIKSKLVEGKKAKKSEDSLSIDVDGLDFSPTFCKSFSSTLLRRCVAATIVTNSQFSRAGFVLDVFSYGIFNTTEEFLEMVKTVPTVVVEIQTDSSVVLRRFSESIGVDPQVSSKVSKENQLALKSLEQQLSTYRSKLLSIESSTPEKKSKQLSHPFTVQISSINEESREKTLIHRLDKFDTEDAINQLLATLKTKRYSNSDESDNIVNVTSLDRTSTEMQQSISLSKNNITNNSVIRESLIKLEEYIVSTVLPSVAEGLISVRRNKPLDPITYMSHHLFEMADNIERNAHHDALQTFYDLLNQTTE